MSDKGILSESCITKGYNRLFDDLGELYLDLPAAYLLANRWVDKSLKAGIIDEKISNNCPKGSMRYVSIKAHEGINRSLARPRRI